jgi:hypothetical protein
MADSSTFQNSQKFDHSINVTVDGGFRYQRLSLQAAFYYRTTSNAGRGNNFGYYGQGGVYIVKERFELAARVSGVIFADRTLLSTPSTNSAMGNTTEYTGGFNIYLFGHGAKLQGDYTYVDNVAFGATGHTPVHRARLQAQILF